MKLEYSQCFQHMRHYDDAVRHLVEVLFSIFAGMSVFLAALFTYLKDATYQNYVTGGILFLLFLVGLIFLILIIRTRVYFVQVTRQVNAIRNYFLENHATIFRQQNLLDTKSSEPKYLNYTSTYFYLFLIIILINGVLLCLGTYFISDRNSIILSVTLGSITLAFQVLVIMYFLNRKDSKSITKQ